LNPGSSDLSFATDMIGKLHATHDRCLFRQSMQCELSAEIKDFFDSLGLALMLLVVVQLNL